MPWTTRAWRTPSRSWLRRRWNEVRCVDAHDLARAPAGLVRGPRTLKTVRMPRARRTGCTAFMAGWRVGAWRKGEAVGAEGGGGLRGREGDGDSEGFEDVG